MTIYTVSPSLPNAGDDESVADPAIRDNLQGIIDVVNGNIDDNNIAAAGLADSSLASPNNAAYKMLLSGATAVSGGQTAATYYFAQEEITASGANQSPAGNQQFTPLLYFDNDDYMVAGLTQRLKLRAQASPNGVAPAINFTVGLYPVSFSGAAYSSTFTLGTVVTGSTVTLTAPGTGSTTSGATASDFAVPSDGLYTFGTVLSGTAASNTYTVLSAQLFTRNT